METKFTFTLWKQVLFSSLLFSPCVSSSSLSSLPSLLRWPARGGSVSITAGQMFYIFSFFMVCCFSFLILVSWGLVSFVAWAFNEFFSRSSGSVVDFAIAVFLMVLFYSCGCVWCWWFRQWLCFRSGTSLVHESDSGWVVSGFGNVVVQATLVSCVKLGLGSLKPSSL